jgi:hypothetical protein
MWAWWTRRSMRHVERELRRRRPGERQRADQRINAALPTGDPRPGRHLGPIDLQHLPRPIAGLLRRPLRAWPQSREPLADQIDRPAVAVVIAQDLRHPRRLDVRPIRQQPTHDRFQGIQDRTRRRPRIPRPLRRLDQPLHRPPVDPQPPRDLALRHAIRGHRPHLSPLQRAAHLPSRLPNLVADDPEAPAQTGRHQPEVEASIFQFLEAAQYSAPGVSCSASADYASRAPWRTNFALILQ